MRPEHAVAMFTLRGGGDEQAAATGMLTKVPSARLVILPATSHIAIAGTAKLFEPLVTPFLDDLPPANPPFGSEPSECDGHTCCTLFGTRRAGVAAPQ